MPLVTASKCGRCTYQAFIGNSVRHKPCYPCVLGMNGGVISEDALYRPRNRSCVLNSLKFLCKAVLNKSRMIQHLFLLFLCALVSTQYARAVAFLLGLTKMDFCSYVKINVKTGTMPITNTQFLVILGVLFLSVNVTRLGSKGSVPCCQINC